MKIINSILDTILKTIMIISSLGVLIVSTIQIVSRFISQMQIGWSTDILRLCFIYAVFSGIAYCAKNNEHLNLDVFLSVLPCKLRKVMEILILMVVIAFCAFLTKYGYDYTISGLNQAVSFTRMPMSIYYAAVPLSTGIMVIYYFQLLVADIWGLFRSKEAA